MPNLHQEDVTNALYLQNLAAQKCSQTFLKHLALQLNIEINRCEGGTASACIFHNLNLNLTRDSSYQTWL